MSLAYIKRKIHKEIINMSDDYWKAQGTDKRLFNSIPSLNLTQTCFDSVIT